MKPMHCLFLALLLIGGVLPAGEPPPPRHLPENPWYGPGSPFNFQDGAGNEKLVQIGNENFWIITLDKLLTDPNPGLARRNVAIIGELGNSKINRETRKWTISLVEKPKVSFGPPEGEFEQNLASVEGLNINDFVLVTGTAKPDGNGSTLLVGKIYRIPNELTRLTAEFGEMKKHPDYAAFKFMADSLAAKATKVRNSGDENGADKLADLRSQVIVELLTFRRAMWAQKHLNVEETMEFLDTTIKYAPDDRTNAQEILKDVLKRDPDNKRAIEAVKALLPDWVRYENKEWMAKADADKLRDAAQAKIDAERIRQIQENVKRMDAVAAMSVQRHNAAIKVQSLLIDNDYKLPAETDEAWQSLVKILSTSEDYRLVQKLLLQSVSQLAPQEWARMVPPVVGNPNEAIRLLGFRLGAFSKDRPTLLWLAQMLVNDKSDALKEDAVVAMSETRAPLTVQALVRCMELNRTDDRLNQLLLRQLQQMTRCKETGLAAWQAYAKDAAKIEIVPE